MSSSAEPSAQRGRRRVPPARRRGPGARHRRATSAPRDGELVAITPTGAALGRARAGAGRGRRPRRALVDGELEPTSELDLHLGVYERFDAGAVVHTHAPMATALSCVIDELPCVHYSMLLLGGTRPGRAVRDLRHAGARRAAVGDALEGRTAALMANHGAVTYAADVDAAVERSLLLEWACTVYWRARGARRAADARRRRAARRSSRRRSSAATARPSRAAT